MNKKDKDGFVIPEPEAPGLGWLAESEVRKMLWIEPGNKSSIEFTAMLAGLKGWTTDHRVRFCTAGNESSVSGRGQRQPGTWFFRADFVREMIACLAEQALLKLKP